MTKTQIANVLKEIDSSYVVNQKIKTEKIAIISTDLDGPIYPGKNTRLLFNASAENLEIFYGKEINGEFIFKGEIPSFVIPYANIYGFTLAGPLHQPEPYKTGQAV